MATLRVLSVTLLFAVLSIQHCICADTTESSSIPAPEAGGDVVSPPPTSAAPESLAPSPLANVISSPASPPPADRSPDSAPAPSPGEADDDTTSSNESPSPAPAPSHVVASDISHESITEANESSSMNGGKKAGVAFGVIAAACVVGLGALVYKKRRQNIRRAQFGYAARRSDFL